MMRTFLFYTVIPVLRDHVENFISEVNLGKGGEL